MATCGIHVIWTTYMTWPPGDSRGHWSPLFDLYGRLIEAGHKLNIPHQPTLQRATALAKESPKILTAYEISVVAEKIGEIVHLAPGMPGAICGLRIEAAAIEPTHVHLLLAPLAHDIEDAVGRLKSQTSSALLKLPDNWNRKRTWTAGYWKAFLFDPAIIPIVRLYIEAHNQRRGLLPMPYAWINPRPI